MIFFGHDGFPLAPHAALRDISVRWRRAHGQAERLLDVLLRLGEVVQGVLDHDLRGLGAERPSTARHHLRQALQQAADEYVWALQGRPARAPGVATLTRLAHEPLPERVEARLVEGFTHYAVLPELYAQVAASSAPASDTRVLGIRSAGVVLAAVVAASVRAPAPHSVRPEGHPFARTINPSPALLRELRADADKSWLIVDEGPGLSGSSFLAAASLLEQAGVARERVRLMPSHAGLPGAAASDESRQRFESYAKTYVCFEQAYAADTLPFRKKRVAFLRWAEGAFVDLSAGRWRHLCFDSPAQFPPAQRTLERRKYWFCEDGSHRLAKFAGLGAVGTRKLRRARLLAERGFIPPLHGARAGFLVSDWLDARPADIAGADREHCLSFLRDYLRFLTRLPALAPDRGAAPPALLAMAEHNVEECLGPDYASALSGFRELASRLDAPPVYTDGKLEPWEFLVAHGRIVKTDALDHAAGCDLVKAQPIAWDLAGASVELELSSAELETLREATAGRRHPYVDDRTHSFYRICYLAFRIAGLSLASQQESDVAELARLDERKRSYLATLAAELQHAR